MSRSLQPGNNATVGQSWRKAAGSFRTGSDKLDLSERRRLALGVE